MLARFGHPLPPREPVWCYVDGTHFVKEFLIIQKQEREKQKEKDKILGESRRRVQDKLDAAVEIFPKQLGR